MTAQCSASGPAVGVDFAAGYRVAHAARAPVSRRSWAVVSKGRRQRARRARQRAPARRQLRAKTGVASCLAFSVETVLKRHGAVERGRRLPACVIFVPGLFDQTGKGADRARRAAADVFLIFLRDSLQHALAHATSGSRSSPWSAASSVREREARKLRGLHPGAMAGPNRRRAHAPMRRALARSLGRADGFGPSWASSGSSGTECRRAPPGLFAGCGRLHACLAAIILPGHFSPSDSEPADPDP